MTLLVFERYYIAHDALMVLTFFPTFIIFFCSLCMARRRNDPARRAFSWLKPAFGFFTLFIFLDFCAYGLSLAATRLSNDSDLDTYENNAEALIRHVKEASAETFVVSRLIESFTDIFTFLTLVNLGIGILIAHSGMSSSFGKFIKFASLGISAILTVLAIACFGLQAQFYSEAFGKEIPDITRKDRSQFNTSRQIDFSFRVLIFILAVGIVAQSSLVKITTRSEPRVSVPSNTFIACGVVWLLRTVYGMAAMASEVNLSNVAKDPVFRNYFDILDVCLGTWPELIVLSLVFGLGTKKANGLWSTEQPFMTRGGNAVSPWGFNYDPNQVSQPVTMQTQPTDQQIWPQYQQQQQQQHYYPPTELNGVPLQQHTIPQYVPQQQTHQPYIPQSQPPPHEDAMGFNHQANGTPPQAVPQPYYEKA